MRYLFIIGCGHSGTSLMLAIWRNSARVAAFVDETTYLEGKSVDEFKSYALSSLDCDNVSWVVEKSPRHVLQVEKILSSSNCHALVMVRNPLDTVASLVKRGVKFDAAVERYHRDNSAWLPFVEHEKLHLVRYEDLVTNGEEILTSLSRQFEVDLKEGNRLRQVDNTIYFKSNGATIGRLTDGKGKRNHLALRNFQVKQEIVDMNGEWTNRISPTQASEVIERLLPFFNQFQYSVPTNLDY